MKSTWLQIISTPFQYKEEFLLRAWRSEFRSVDSSCCLLQSQHPIQSLQPPAHFLPSPDKFSSSFPKVAPGKDELDWIEFFISTAVCTTLWSIQRCSFGTDINNHIKNPESLGAIPTAWEISLKPDRPFSNVLHIGQSSHLCVSGCETLFT